MAAEVLKPTMHKNRAKGQQRIVGKGRLRRRNVLDRSTLAFRGMDFAEFSKAAFGRTLKRG